METTLRFRHVAVVLVLASAGLAASRSHLALAQGAPHQMDEVDNPADKAFLGAMHDMMVGMHRNMPTGNTDRDFVRLMVPHHQSAVEMAKAELQYGTDADLKTLAQAIVTDQEREIALMKAWEDKHPK